MPDPHVVSPSVKGVGFHQFRTADLRRGKADHQLIFALLKVPGATYRHGCLVGWEHGTCCTTNKPGLGYVDPVFVLVQQGNVFGLVRRIAVLDKLGSNQRAALAVKGQFEHIRAHHDLFSGCGGDGGCYHRWAWNCRSGRRRRDRHYRAAGRSPGATRSGRDSHHCRLAGRREKSGLLAVVYLPLVPQQNHGKAKDHPQNSAANIVHEGFF